MLTISKKYYRPNDDIIYLEVSFDDSVGSNSSSKNVRWGRNVLVITYPLHVFK